MYSRKKPGLTRYVSRNVPELVKVAELPGPWELSFDPKWGGPAQVTFDKLEDWTHRSEEGVKFYSGTAVYRKSFVAPSVRADGRYYLDLGLVKNLARIKLNGRDLGVLWCAPWRVDISAAVKPGPNELEVSVANLWPNRLIGDKGRPASERVTSTTWNPFTPDSPLLESGLLGPVVLLKEQP